MRRERNARRDGKLTTRLLRDGQERSAHAQREGQPHDLGEAARPNVRGVYPLHEDLGDGPKGEHAGAEKVILGSSIAEDSRDVSAQG